MLTKAKNDNAKKAFSFNKIIYEANGNIYSNIRSSKQDSEKKVVLCKSGDDITRLGGMLDGIYGFYFLTQ
jgi:hypothetical protein